MGINYTGLNYIGIKTLCKAQGNDFLEIVISQFILKFKYIFIISNFIEV